jgi:predicted O-methyltransferase YrrM
MSVRGAYESAFHTERMHLYPAIGAFEDKCGYAIGRERLETAARTLACPVKAHPPNWQHGRVLYAVARQRLAASPHTLSDPALLVDIGTAKGFSALCLQWALLDSGSVGAVISADVVDPDARVRRNSVAELDGLLTVREFVKPWPEAEGIVFTHTASKLWLGTFGRVPVAFVDGKHTYQAVKADAKRVAAVQQIGDVMVFDDLHIPGIAAAVAELKGYSIERIEALPCRVYAVARRAW